MGAKPKVSKAERRRYAALYEDMVARARAAGDLPAAADASGRGDDDLKPLAWYVLTVTPMCEKAVANRLKRRVPGLVTYYPVATRKVRHDGKSQRVEWLPMPRYLFVGFDREPPWLWVFDVQGVQSVLGIDDRPVAIPPTVLGDLMWRCETHQVGPAYVPVGIHKGIAVVARRGVMKGFEGEVKKVHKQTGLVEVMFDMIGQLKPVTMRLDDLASVAYA